MPVFERMRAVTPGSSTTEPNSDRQSRLGQLAARRLELSRIEQALRRTQELATDVATAMEEALER